MAMKYIIGSGSLPGLPARDLTDDEVLEFGRLYLLKSGLYQDEKEKPVKKVIEKIEKEIKDLLGVNADVKLVEPKSIQRSEGKAQRVVDKRKI